MRYWSSLIIFSMVLSGISVAHELTGQSESNIEGHALYHKISSIFPRVDTLRIKSFSSETIFTSTYYFDPIQSFLYTCLNIGKDDPITCSGPERAHRYTWNEAEMEYGRKNSLSPIDRHFQGSVYFLEGAIPMSQSTTFIYYQGTNRAVRCRKTLTIYKFEVERNGEHIYFNSDKEDSYDVQCENIYPK